MSAKKKTSVARSAAPSNPVSVCFNVKGAPGVPVRLAVAGAGAPDGLLVTAGEPVSLVPGRYALVGDWSPNWDRRIFCGYVYSTPPLSVDCNVVVPEDGGDVEVPARMRCFTLRLGYDCESYRVRGYDGIMSPLQAPCYIAGSWSLPALDLTAIPTPESGRRAKTYALVTDGQAARLGQFVVENGRTYSFTPEPKEKK